MSRRERVAALIVRDGLLLVVRQRRRSQSGRHDGPCYLTPPGGGVEPGETPLDAVTREVSEEVGLSVTAASFVSYVEHSGGTTAVFDVEVEPGEPVLGSDPDLECDCPRMVGVEWVPVPPRSVWRTVAAVKSLIVDVPSS